MQSLISNKQYGSQHSHTFLYVINQIVHLVILYCKMSDPSVDVLNDIDALLSKLKHLPGGARLNALNKLQECLVEINTSPEQGGNVIVTKKNENTVDTSSPRKSLRKGKAVHKEGTSKGVSTTVSDKSSTDEISDDDPTPDKDERNATKSNSKRRLPSLPNWFNNFSDVPQFLTAQTRTKKSKIEPKLTKTCTVILERKEIKDLPEITPESEQNKDKNSETTDSNVLQNTTVDTKFRRGRKKTTIATETEDNGRTCQICNRTYINSSYLRIHMRKHTGEKPFSCDICERKFTQKSSLWVHMKRHEGKYDHKCTECDYKSVLKIDLIRHMPKHTGAKVFICEQCGKMFTTDMRLKDHIRHVHVRNEKHVCDKCGFSTHRADNLRRHIAVKHSEDELFKCPVCGDVLKQRWTFIVHLRRHTGERPHTCKECGKGFKSLSQLAVHRRTHREGEHVCPDCDRKFKTKHHLVRHSIIHSGLKPYTCSYCPYTCNVKGNINKHMKAVHKLSNFSFKTQNKEQAESQNKLTDEQSAIARGQQVTQEFLQRISMRKDEQLTIEALQQQLPKPNNNPVPEEPVLLCRRNRNEPKKQKNSVLKIEKNFQISSDPLLSTDVLQDSTILIANNEVVKTSDTDNNDLLLLSVKQCIDDDQMEMVQTIDQRSIVQTTITQQTIDSQDSSNNNSNNNNNNNAPMIYVIRVVP